MRAMKLKNENLKRREKLQASKHQAPEKRQGPNIKYRGGDIELSGFYHDPGARSVPDGQATSRLLGVKNHSRTRTRTRTKQKQRTSPEGHFQVCLIGGGL